MRIASCTIVATNCVACKFRSPARGLAGFCRYGDRQRRPYDFPASAIAIPEHCPIAREIPKNLVKYVLPP
jgi:hypothetical protein